MSMPGDISMYPLVLPWSRPGELSYELLYIGAGLPPRRKLFVFRLLMSTVSTVLVDWFCWIGNDNEPLLPHTWFTSMSGISDAGQNSSGFSSGMTEPDVRLLQHSKIAHKSLWIRGDKQNGAHLPVIFESVANIVGRKRMKTTVRFVNAQRWTIAFGTTSRWTQWSCIHMICNDCGRCIIHWWTMTKTIVICVHWMRSIRNGQWYCSWRWHRLILRIQWNRTTIACSSITCCRQTIASFTCQIRTWTFWVDEQIKIN